MQPPSVLFLNRVYPPGSGATGELLAELAPALVRAGWRVTVIASRPAGAVVAQEDRAGVRIEWVGGLPFTRRSTWRRALSYLSLYPALLGRAWRLPAHDVVVVLTDPPLLAVLGPLIRWVKGSRLVHWAQDVYPEVAEELGVVRPRGFLAGILRRLSTWALRRCSRVVVVGRCMRDRLLARGLAPDRLAVIPNWAEPEQLRPAPADVQRARAELGADGRFVVMYSGNLGLAHSFDALLAAAERLQPLVPSVLFAIVGDGPRLPALQAEVARRGLRNVRFFPPVPRARLGASLAAADIHLVSMRDELWGLVVPSKVYGVLAVGRPVVFLGPRSSEAARLIEEAGCGSVLPADHASLLAECLSGWAADAGRSDRARAAAAAVVAGTGVESSARAFAAELQKT